MSLNYRIKSASQKMLSVLFYLLAVFTILYMLILSSGCSSLNRTHKVRTHREEADYIEFIIGDSVYYIPTNNN